MGNQLDKPDSLDAPNHSAQRGGHGSQVSHDDELRLAERVRAVVPWLDHKTSALVASIVAVVAAEHPEVQAAILFGSAARHEERPLDDAHPSDVDMLLLVTPDPARQRLLYAQQLALWESIGEAQYRHRDAPREVEVTLVESTLTDWDELFVTNVARDGLLLWARDATAATLPSRQTDSTVTTFMDTTESASVALPVAWRHLALGVTGRIKR